MSSVDDIYEGNILLPTSGYHATPHTSGGTVAITTHRARVNPHTEEHGNSSVQDILRVVTNTIDN